MEAQQDKSSVLPENAFRELQPGEVYQPIVPADLSPPEVTLRSVLLGLGAVVLFTFAAAYIGLKTGNVIETSIPIAILAVAIGNTLMRMMTDRRNTLLENVIIQSLGQASGVVVAGAIFTIPALYINQLNPNFFQIFLSCMLGGFLGVVLLIPLRRYFCAELHGQLPFPEATAIVNVLATGEKSKGSAGIVLGLAFALGFVYDLFVEFVHLWNGHLSSQHLFGRFGRALADKRFELRLNATAVYFGLGYIIGPRYAGIIAAGSVLSYLVFVPMIFFIGSGMQLPVAPETSRLIAEMSAGDIWGTYARPVGIGCIAIAGLIGIIKMGKIILSSLTLAFKGLVGTHPIDTALRTDRDISPKNTFLIQLGSAAGMLLLFWWVSGSLKYALIGTVITFVLAFLFTPVAARAIAIVGVNPVSGMTLITLIIACLALVAAGLGGDALGQTIALIIGCAVCTALSTSGAFVSDLKIGFWTGASPYKQERWKYLGIVVASLCVGVIIWVMNDAYGFLIEEGGRLVPNPDMPAPQGNLMAAIVSGVMGGQEQPLLLYALGGVMAVLLEMASVPALAFGLGMYLPIEINMAVFAGAAAGAVISNSGGSEKVRKARAKQGTLIASGVMAGAAIVGTVGAFGKLPALGEPINWIDLEHLAKAGGWSGMLAYLEGFWGQAASVAFFLLLSWLCYKLAAKGAEWQMAEDAEDAS